MVKVGVADINNATISHIGEVLLSILLMRVFRLMVSDDY